MDEKDSVLQEKETESVSRKKREVDVTDGPLFSSIIRFSLPVMFGSLVLFLFNAADTIVLGRLGTMNAVSSVGSTSAIVSLLVTSFVGFSGGTNVVLARLVGQKNAEDAKKCIDTSIVFAFFCGVAIAVLGFFASGWFLEITDCPAECVDGAKLYMQLYFAAAPAILVYNFGSAIIRVSGDTKRPLYYLIFSGALNVVLNVALCLVWEQKVAAVAVATLFSQLLGAGLVMQRLFRNPGICSFSFKNISCSWRMLGRILKIGLPCGISSSMYSISNMQIQSAINSWGPAAIAGNTACSSLEGLIGAFTGAFNVAVVAFIGQNIGCGKADRVRKSFAICAIIGTTVGNVLGLSVFAFGRSFLSLYLPGEAEAIECGMIRMSHILAWYGLCGLRQALGGSIQAFGYSNVNLGISITCTLLFRVIWMIFVYPYVLTLENLYLCYTISWILDGVVSAIFMAFIFRKYRSGTYKKV